MKKPDAGPFAIRVWKFDRWVFVGPLYQCRDVAKSWLPFVRKAWSGMRCQVVSRQKADREKAKRKAAQ